MNDTKTIIGELDPDKFKCSFCGKYKDNSEYSDVSQIDGHRQPCCKACEGKARILNHNRNFKETIENDTDAKLIMPDEVKNLDPKFYARLRNLIGYRSLKEHVIFLKYKNRITVRLFTKSNRYCITSYRATLKKPKGYLGCIVISTTPKVGETWTRGCDLPDGPNNNKTWNSIIKSIASYEIIKLECWRDKECSL